MPFSACDRLVRGGRAWAAAVGLLVVIPCSACFDSVPAFPDEDQTDTGKSDDSGKGAEGIGDDSADHGSEDSDDRGSDTTSDSGSSGSESGTGDAGSSGSESETGDSGSGPTDDQGSSESDTGTGGEDDDTSGSEGGGSTSESGGSEDDGGSSGGGSTSGSGGSSSGDHGGTECEPDETESETQPCGNCGEQRRTRDCTSDGTWGDWGTWGACSGEGVCSPDDDPMEVTDENCGVCPGSIRHGVRACTTACQWGAVVWGSCLECQADPALNSCEPNLQACECNPDNDTCGNGSRCCTAPVGMAIANSCWSDTFSCPRMACSDGGAGCLPGYSCVNSICVPDFQNAD